MEGSRQKQNWHSWRQTETFAYEQLIMDNQIEGNQSSSDRGPSKGQYDILVTLGLQSNASLPGSKFY